MRECKIVIPGERPMSWNKLYAGKHWKYRADVAKNRHALIRAYIDPDEPMFDHRVDVEVIAYFDKRPLDSCNIPAKIYIDGFIGWYFKDDNPRHVRRVTTESRIDRDNPRLEITLTEVDDEWQW